MMEPARAILRSVTWVDKMLTWAGAAPPAGSTGRPPGGASKTGRHDPLSFTIDLSGALREAWTGSGAYAPRVSRAEALSVPAVKRVRDLICATLGTLGVEELDPKNRRVSNELLAQPEADVPRSITYTMTAEDMLFEEVAWWRVTEWTPEGWPRHVRRLIPGSVNVRKSGRVYYSDENGTAQGMAEEYIPDAELIRFDSPWPGMLTHGARTIRDAMAVARAASRSVENPVPLGFLTPRDSEGVDAADPPDIDNILDEFQDAIDRRAWPYLNAALKAEKLSWSPEELQLGQTRDAVVLEIARLGNIDPEELGVSTTSRTYANAEQRRLDLIDFTLNPFAVAMQDRLSMGDVTFPGNKVRFIYESFLRSDTLTRMQVYEIGLRVGAYDAERIARLEEIPTPASASSELSALERATVMQRTYLAKGATMTWAEIRAELIRAGIKIDPNMPEPSAATATPAVPVPAETE